MSLIKTYPFTTPGNYTYDSSLIEVTGGVARLKQIVFANECMFNDFNDSTTLHRSNGTAAIVSSGGTPSVAGGLLDLNAGDYIVYNGDNIANANQFTIEFNVIPRFTGGGSGINILYCEHVDATGKSVFQIYLESGQLKFQCLDTTGTNIFTVSGAFSATSGTNVHISANIDLTGTSEFYVNGSLFASTSNTGTRSNTINFVNLGTTYVGGGGSVDPFDIDNFQRFDAKIRTAAFTPSSEDYTDYTSTSPSIYSDAVSADGLDGYSVTSTNGLIKHVINVDGVDKYYNTGTSQWENSSGASQSNTAAEIEANKASLDISSGATIYPKWYLTTTDGYDRDELDSVTLTYNFFNSPETLTKCLVNYEVYDAYGDPIQGARVIFDPDDFFFGEAHITKEVTVYSDANGKLEAPIVESESTASTYTIKIKLPGENEVTFPSKTIPNKQSEPLSAIIG